MFYSQWATSYVVPEELENHSGCTAHHQGIDNLEVVRVDIGLPS